VRVKILGIRHIPERGSLWTLLRGRAPVSVQRREIPYWQERGWSRRGDVYSGNYQTRFGAFQGVVEAHGSRHFSFFIKNAPPELRGHHHWTCFQQRGEGQYLVHMGRMPRDVSSGIMAIERLIQDAFEERGER